MFILKSIHHHCYHYKIHGAADAWFSDQVVCYWLNDSVSPESYVEVLIPIVMVFGGRVCVCVDSLVYDGGALQDWNCVLMRKDMGRELLSLHVRIW